MKYMFRVLLIVLAIVSSVDLGWAQRGRGGRGGGGRGGGGFSRGGGGFQSRGAARPSVNMRPSNPISSRPNINRGDVNRGDFNRDIGRRDVDINRPVNVGDINVNRDFDRDWDRYGCCHPVARAAVRTAAVVGTAAVIGSYTYALPASCTSVYIDGITYEQCGTEWYQPHFVGTSARYLVVAPPR